MKCGRIRKQVGNGVNVLLDGELELLKAGIIELDAGQEVEIETGDREYGFVLISGQFSAGLADGAYRIGPRNDPYQEAAWGLLCGRDEKVALKAGQPAVIGFGSAPAAKKVRSQLITPDRTGGGSRGLGNWQREVRFVIWSDNSEGNALLMGETVTPSGNWCTVPPHRHQRFTQGQEVPYEEAYLLRFQRPEGAALVWQFDDNGEMDQCFSLRNNDIAYMDGGYHPVVSFPGSAFYQLTIMAGPHRVSSSRVHDAYRFLLEENSMDNPYARQAIKK